jgi:peptide/nickel transport system ATP-binding protein
VDGLVEGVSFSLDRSRTLAIVGESGSGKSLTCKAIAGLLGSNLQAGGDVTLAGRKLLDLTERDWRGIRGREIGFVFQNPFSALNPVLTIGQQITEPLRLHANMSRRDARQEAARLLDLVRSPQAARRLDDYPHQFSGGMCQRVAIAMAIACKPKLLIADEPTTALDVTVQADILDLLTDLRRELGLAVVMVTHDFGVAAQIADEIMVMYGGTLMERGSARDILGRPQHPYTLGLLRASPANGVKGRPLHVIPGSATHPLQDRRSCPFSTRCDKATAACKINRPVLQTVGRGHAAACLRLTATEMAA